MEDEIKNYLVEDNGYREDIKTLLLGRKNIRKGSEYKTIRELEFEDFKLNGSIKPYNTSDFVIFVDDDLNTRIFKNRFGYKGNVI